MTTKHRLLSHNSATLASPTNQSLGDQIAGSPKYWSSERVPHTKYSIQRQFTASSALSPFNGGRALPSKWEDAERWISSPVMYQQQQHEGGSNNNNVLQYGSKTMETVQFQQRRAKSKSGPLGSPGSFGAYYGYGSYSPSMVPVIHCGGSSLTVESPLTRSFVAAGGCGGRRSCPGQTEEELACTRDWLELFSQPRRASNSNVDKLSDGKKGLVGTRPDISRRNVATQMQPPTENSTACSPLPPASSSPPPAITACNQRTEAETVVIRDVKVDKEDTSTTRPARNNRRETSQRFSDAAREFRDSPRRSTTESHIAVTKLRREEAKIDAWENLQRAKAEAAIRELEMNLEKERSSSVDKILKKLKRAQRKAERVRSSLSDNGKNGGCRRKATRKMVWMCWKIRMSSVEGSIIS